MFNNSDLRSNTDIGSTATPKPVKTRKCGLCRETGHTAKTCPGKNGQLELAAVMEKAPAELPSQPVTIEIQKPKIVGLSIADLALPLDEIEPLEAEYTDVIEIRRPRKHDYVWFLSPLEWARKLPLLKWDGAGEENGQEFVVYPQFEKHFPGDIVYKMCCPYVNQEGSLFLWPIRTPNSARSKSPLDPANASAYKIATENHSRWLSVRWCRKTRRNVFSLPEGELDAPMLPTKTPGEIVTEAFDERLIDSGDHHLIHRKKGIKH
jgi:hypothetical protein